MEEWLLNIAERNVTRIENITRDIIYIPCIHTIYE